MRIFTNPGSNMPRAVLERYGIVLTPQRIVGDGLDHDTRVPVPLGTVDEWVRAPELPHVVGTTAPEMVSLLVEHLPRDPEILIITASRRIIRTYDAAVVARDLVASRPRFAGARIRVVDSKATDVLTGLLVLAAARAAEGGATLDEATALVERLRDAGQLVMYLHTLENVVRGGRVGHLRRWLADALDLRALLTFQDGEIADAGKVRKHDDRLAVIADRVTASLAGKRVWAAIGHGNAPLEAEALMREIARRCQVVHSWVHPLASSLYVHCGPGALGAAVLPAS